jgi:hypothetical protein
MISWFTKNFSYIKAHSGVGYLHKMPLLLSFKRSVHWRKTFVAVLINPVVVTDVPLPYPYSESVDKDGIFIVDFDIYKRIEGLTSHMILGSSIWHDSEKCYGWHWKALTPTKIRCIIISSETVKPRDKEVPFEKDDHFYITLQRDTHYIKSTPPGARKL